MGERSQMPRRRRWRAPLVLFIIVVALGLVGALLVARANNHQTTPVPATVAALRTQVANLEQQAVARQTQIARQQDRIEQLQRIVAAEQTPTYQANGPHSYIALFQIDKYSYVLYLQWDESNGFIRNGRILTADDYARKGTRSFQFNGIDNHGKFGFTGTDQGVSMTFTGTANSDGTFTVTGLPWYVFYGFVGGTFTQTLHAGTLDQYNAAAANLANPPH